MLDRVRNEFRNEVQKRLSGRPDVVAALFEAIDDSATQLKANNGKSATG